ncbi:MAG: nucleoside monophosphate kinase [Caldimicrobium sp.]
MNKTNNKIKAILLLGPTGAGKTPLGMEIEKRGFLNEKAWHFDFGENLRKVASGELSFPKEERLLVQSILKEGRLLKEEEFYLAERVLLSFLINKHYTPDSWLVLNGLPRNLFQASKLENFAEIKYVIFLKTSPTILKFRLSFDPAGDRKGRSDDLEKLVEYKLSWFYRETLPLLDYYKEKSSLIHLEVQKSDTGEDLYKKLCLSINRKNK